jgi:hypothetical protein
MKVSRKLWLGLLAGVAAVSMASVPASAQQQQKPNILFIMGDDIGWMQPSIYHRGRRPRPSDLVRHESNIWPGRQLAKLAGKKND